MSSRLRTSPDQLRAEGLEPAGERVVADIVARFALLYDRAMPADTLRRLTAIWIEELADHPADLLREAYHHVVRSHTGGWFPKPAEIVERMAETLRERHASLRRASAQARKLPPPPPSEAERLAAYSALARIRAHLREAPPSVPVTMPEPGEPGQRRPWNAKIPGFTPVPMPWEQKP